LKSVFHVYTADFSQSVLEHWWRRMRYIRSHHQRRWRFPSQAD